MVDVESDGLLLFDKRYDGLRHEVQSLLDLERLKLEQASNVVRGEFTVQDWSAVGTERLFLYVFEATLDDKQL